MLTRRKTIILSNRQMSKLIRIGLADLEEVEKSSQYKINMGVWHKPNSHCSVCLAGSVMANTLKIDPKKRVDPWDFGKRLQDQLEALNFLRSGCVLSAASRLGITHHYESSWEKFRSLNRYIPEYSTRWKGRGFKSAMHKLADDLEAIGY